MILKHKNKILMFNENDIEFLMSVYNRFSKTWSVFVCFKSGKTIKVLSKASSEKHQEYISDFAKKAKTSTIEKFC